MTDVITAVRDPERLAALRRLVLLDTPPSPAFDRLTRMAARLLDAPIALLTLVDVDRQWFKSAHGLPEPLATARQTPLAYSFCQYVVGAAQAVSVADAHDEPLARDHPAVKDFGVRAYAGMPVFSPDGYVVGSLCVLDISPRTWTETDLANLEDLAAIAMREVVLHIHDRREAHRRAWKGTQRGLG